MNNATLSGHLGKDPEVKYIGEKNTALTTFSLAVSRGFGDKKTTDWYQLKSWGKQGEVIAEYFKKGDRAAFSGELEIEKWTNKEGAEQTSPTLVIRNFDFPNKPKGEQGKDKAGNSPLPF